VDIWGIGGAPEQPGVRVEAGARERLAARGPAQEQGELPVGSGLTQADAHAGVVVERNGIRFGFLAYTYDQQNGNWHDIDERIALANPAQVQHDVAAMLRRADVALVLIALPAPSGPEQEKHCSSSSQSAPEIFPVRNSSQYLHMSVPLPISTPRQFPDFLGPPFTWMVGRFALAAPINCAGPVLSQFESRTTASIGLERSVSSTSIAIRLRYSMAVGFMNSSPSEIVGNSRGRPPADRTPRFTASATSRRFMLQLFSSLQEFAIPTTGRPLY